MKLVVMRIELIILLTTTTGALTTMSMTLIQILQSAEAFTPDWIPMYSDLVYAPVSASGENVYVTWGQMQQLGIGMPFLQ